MMLITAFPVLAEPPPYVTGLNAEVKNGQIEVSWSAQPGENVDFYRIYYSFESILDNEGLFDDFEETIGPINSYTITDPPPVDTLYIAVIGVSPEGEDINMFVEEIAVDLSGEDDTFFDDDFGDDDWLNDNAPEEEPFEPFAEDPFETTPEEENSDSFWENFFSSEEELPETIPAGIPQEPTPEDTELKIKDEKLLLPGEEPPRQQPQATTTPDTTAQPTSVPEELTTVSLYSAKASSPTEVLLKLSGPVTVEPEKATEAFQIVDANGNNLAITYMAIEGGDIVVTTVEQAKDGIYEFRMSEPAYSPDGLPLDPINRSAFFLAHPDSTGAPVLSPQQKIAQQKARADGPLQGIENFKIGATPLATGNYDVTARWDVIGDKDEISYYIVHQTRDGGKTFGEPQTLTPDIGGVEIANVMPGPLGISLSFMHVNGMMYQAGFEQVNIGPGVAPPPQAPTQITTPPTPANTYIPSTKVTTPPHSDDLSDSGPVTVGASMVIVGSVMGWRRMRKKLLA